MSSRARSVGAFALAVALAVAVAACGGGSSNNNKSSGGGGGGGGTPASKGGNITVLLGTAPDYLDPGEGYTTQSVEFTWLSYLPLYSYAHATGQAGTKVIPALAQDYPQISNGGKTYTMTLRPNMKYSNGKAVKASDFRYAIERACKINWGGKPFFTGYIKGAAEYDKGKAKTISGIKTDDSTGKITIQLTQPYGAFLNVLAFPSAAPVPTGTPMKNLSNDPPPGVGPYAIKNVVPNRSWQLVRNPSWTDSTIPGIPAGHVDVTAKISSNTQTEAEQVLQNQADVFDWGDQVPPALAAQVQAKASDRFSKVTFPSTFYFFLNTRTKPFNNQLAREAVNMAIDRRALSRLGSGNYKPTCWFLPEGMVGHPTGPCPYGDPNQAPNMAKAKQLLQQSGMAGQSVTVWGETRSPRKEFIDYYTDVLNKLGFKAKSKIIADAQYFPTIGNLKTNAQTGFADWLQDFPNPSDFYLLMDKNTIQPINNENFSLVADPHIQSELAKLNPVPANKLQSVAGEWQKLDEYLAKKAYIAAYGQELAPKFYSNRIDYGKAVFHPLYGNDFSTFQLK